MKADELREKYLKFFEEKGHNIIPSSPLVPENDPTVLFTSAGMQPLVPYLLGQKHPMGTRLVDAQKCLRTGDIDEVGDETHLTFFEMLGNWSLGDYFKEDAIKWSFEFLTEELEIPIEKIAVSVFEGEGQIPKDEESANIWKSLGIPEERIAYLDRDENWWGPVGKTGPCGPDTEMFYWSGDENPPKEFDPENDLWVEIWNDVFMEYNKTKKGEYVPLEQKNVDTGMGFERTLAALNNKKSPFETELFTPIIEKVKELSNTKDIDRAEKIISDHIKAATFILSEKITPSNTERGYVLRRLIRRAIRFGWIIGIRENFTDKIAEVVINIYKDHYKELEDRKDFIIKEIIEEENNFRETLEKGIKELEKLEGPKISGEEAFNLYQTHGFPLEITKDIAKEKGWSVDVEGFNKEYSKHQELSRTASAGKFKGGLADESEEVVKQHTATHLLHQSLRQVLGDKVKQRGSNINSERLRFDFSLDRKMTDEEIKKVEDLVNKKIKENLKVKKEEMDLDEAIKSGALGFFEEKYPDRVTVYSIYDPESGEIFSREICGGPHVNETGELGKFKIIKEKSSSKGVRRIKAVLED